MKADRSATLTAMLQKKKKTSKNLFQLKAQQDNQQKSHSKYLHMI